VQNGRLASVSASTTGLGYGLLGMRERVEALGGSFASGAAGDVWIVQATLRLAAAS